jgi:hypothetical protein
VALGFIRHIVRCDHVPGLGALCRPPRTALEYRRAAFLAHLLQAVRPPTLWRRHPGFLKSDACSRASGYPGYRRRRGICGHELDAATAALVPAIGRLLEQVEAANLITCFIHSFVKSRNGRRRHRSRGRIGAERLKLSDLVRGERAAVI